MAAGCAPVVPRDVGPWFNVLDQKQGKYGYSYSSAQKAADIIRILLENEGLRKEVSARAHERAAVLDSCVFERRILGVVEKTCSRSLNKYSSANP
jgi:glycosyltransferase involved in cell wall biosynthesis